MNVLFQILFPLVTAAPLSTLHFLLAATRAKDTYRTSKMAKIDAFILKNIILCVLVIGFDF